MKRMRRAAAIIVAFIVLALSVIIWRQVNHIPDVFIRGEVTVKFNCSVPAADEGELTLLKAYFSLRCGSFARAARIKDAADGMDADLALSETVKKNENSRVNKLRSLQRAWKCRFSGASSELRIDGWKEENGTAVCLLYEFQWFKSWFAGFTLPQTADLSGYGVRHVLRLERGENGAIKLTTDNYDEGRPTFAATEGRMTDPDYTTYAGIPSEKPETADTSFWKKLFPPKRPFLPSDPAAFVPLYSPNRAIEYADTWTADYNTGEYPNLAPLGGDCCNFTSQCLYAGGMPLTADWTHHGLDTGSSAWISSTRLYALLTGQTGIKAVGRGMAVLCMDDAAGRYVRLGGKRLPASAVFYKGSPVFYCWRGEYIQTGWWNHVAICVGTMGDGTPAVSCHTSDKYHMKWNYGGDGCDYGTVQLTSG